VNHDIVTTIGKLSNMFPYLLIFVFFSDLVFFENVQVDAMEAMFNDPFFFLFFLMRRERL